MIVSVRGGPVALAVTALLTSAASAQTSPASQLDLGKPQFDTVAPTYNLDGVAGKSADTVVAEVDGTPIALGQVGDAIRALHPGFGDASFATLFPRVLDKLIRQEAIVRAARHRHLDDDPIVRGRMKAAADYVLASEFVQRQTDAAVTEQMLLDRYARDIAGKPGSEEAHVRIILVRTEQEAANIVAALRTGADFATLAKQASLDSTAPQGGDLGFLTRDSLNAEIGTAAFLLKPGEVAPFPVRTGNAWCVVKVEARRIGPTPSFATARNGLATAIRRDAIASVVQAAMAGVAIVEHSLMGPPHRNEAAQ